jgi:hypothetical protein
MYYLYKKSLFFPGKITRARAREESCSFFEIFGPCSYVEVEKFKKCFSTMTFLRKKI